MKSRFQELQSVQVGCSGASLASVVSPEREGLGFFDLKVLEAKGRKTKTRMGSGVSGGPSKEEERERKGKEGKKEKTHLGFQICVVVNSSVPVLEPELVERETSEDEA